MRDAIDLRVFFALWPDEELRAGLAQVASRIPIERSARRVPDYNLHLTLHFIGNIYRDQLDCLQRQARRVAARPFALEIDCSGYFARSRVAWLGCRTVPTPLLALHNRLGRFLRHCDYHPEARRYHPHVSVARKLGAAPAPIEFAALHWPVERFALIESRAQENGVKYEVLETYPLA